MFANTSNTTTITVAGTSTANKTPKCMIKMKSNSNQSHDSEKSGSKPITSSEVSPDYVPKVEVRGYFLDNSCQICLQNSECEDWVVCDGGCGRRHHHNCITQYKDIQSNETKKLKAETQWLCPYCRTFGLFRDNDNKTHH